MTEYLKNVRNENAEDTFVSGDAVVRLYPANTTLPAGASATLPSDGQVTVIGFLDGESISFENAADETILRGFAGSREARRIYANGEITFELRLAEAASDEVLEIWSGSEKDVDGKYVFNPAKPKEVRRDIIIQWEDVNTGKVMRYDLVNAKATTRAALEVANNNWTVYALTFSAEEIAIWPAVDPTPPTPAPGKTNWELTVLAEGGTFVLTANDTPTEPIAYDATAETIELALEATGAVVAVSGDAGEFDIVFSENTVLTADGAELTGEDASVIVE